MTDTPVTRLRELHTCSVSGCPKPAIARGWCNLHYRRFRRHGDVLATVEPRLAWKGSPEARFWAKVNKDGPVPLADAALRAYREGDCPGCSFRRQTGGNHDDVPTGDADPNCAYREATP